MTRTRTSYYYDDRLLRKAILLFSLLLVGISFVLPDIKWSVNGEHSHNHHVFTKSNSFFLGVMIDGGRHHFPTDWLKVFMENVVKMDLTVIHMTITNDQRFNLPMDDVDQHHDEDDGYNNNTRNNDTGNSSSHGDGQIQSNIPSLGRLPFSIPSNSAKMTIKSRSRHHHGRHLNASTSNGTNNVPPSGGPTTSNVYTSQDWQDLNRYAHKLNLTIIPEVSIPFNVASWAGIPNLIMDCPNYVCMVGNTVPFNIEHPQLVYIVRKVIRHVITLLDHPPIIHLGGNDYNEVVTAASRCWNEATDREGNNHNNNHNGPRMGVDHPTYHLYDKFEEMLSMILFGTIDDSNNNNDYDDGLGYRPEQFIRSPPPPPPPLDRWSGLSGRSSSGSSIGEWVDDGGAKDGRITTTNHTVGGSVYQYKKHRLALDVTNDYILQPIELNMATTVRGGTTGWDIYQQTLKIIQAHQDRSNFRGMIVSTEALDPSMMEQRNVMGRLLAISMAVYRSSDSDSDRTNDNPNVTYYPHFTTQADFEEAYLLRCRQLFEDTDGTAATTSFTLSGRPAFCHLLGTTDQSNGSEQMYQKQYREMWRGWTKTICHRLTVVRPDQLELTTVPKQVAQSIQDVAFAKYWEDLNEVPTQTDGDPQSFMELPNTMGESVNSNDPFQERTEQQDKGMSTHSKVLKGRERVIHRPSVLHPLFGTSTITHRGVILDLVDTLVPPHELGTFMEDVMAPLGFNSLQLSLMTRLGCVMELKALNHLFHVVPRPTHVDPPTDETLHGIVRIGNKVGIEVIPEISITTQATGWYHADFLVACPKTLCDTGEIVNDVTRGSLLPVLLAVVRKLRGIFNNTSFIHLGSDDRNASEACWKESGKTPDYDQFEEMFSLLLNQKGWYNSTNIVRWENQERVVYPKRTGRVTQYQYSVPQISNPLDATTTDPLMFGSILSTSGIDPWNIYTQTRQWVKASPRGLFLKVSPADLRNSKQNLVAFAVGLSSNRPQMTDATELDDFLAQLCRTNPSFCPVSAEAARGVPSSRVQYLCRSMTRSTSDPVMRENGALSTLELTRELDDDSK